MGCCHSRKNSIDGKDNKPKKNQNSNRYESSMKGSSELITTSMVEESNINLDKLREYPKGIINGGMSCNWFNYYRLP